MTLFEKNYTQNLFIPTLRKFLPRLRQSPNQFLNRSFGFAFEKVIIFFIINVTENSWNE